MHLHVHHISLEEEAKYVARTRVGACGVMGRGVYIGARHGGLRLGIIQNRTITSALGGHNFIIMVY